MRGLISDAEGFDGVAPVGEGVLRALAGDSGEHLLITGPDDPDDVAGYLNLSSSATAELVVRPDARRRGIGTALIRTAIEHAGPQIRLWSHGTLPAAQAAATALNLRSVRELIQMRRPLAGVSEVSVPQGMSIRTFGDSDRQQLLRVNNAAFSWHPEQGGWTDADITDRVASSWFDPEGLFLAFDDRTGELLGFHWTKVHADGLGEVYVLGVDPSAQGRGLGRTLTLVGLSYLARRLGSVDDATVMLYVEATNASAINTYRRLDFVTTSVDTAYALA